MKNQRIVRRKKLAKIERKRVERNERRKNLKQHDANLVINAVRKMDIAKNTG
jgi:hypothetical protein